MSDTPALTLQDLLNDIERNAYDGVSFTEEIDAAYTLAAEMGKTINQLKAENAELQQKLFICQESEQEKVIEYLGQEIVDWEDMYRAITAENAKLRELVRGLLTGYECGRGELCEGCTWTGMEDPHEFRCPARVKARELGVEVDG